MSHLQYCMILWCLPSAGIKETNIGFRQCQLTNFCCTIFVLSWQTSPCLYKLGAVTMWRWITGFECSRQTYRWSLLCFERGNQLLELEQDRFVFLNFQPRHQAYCRTPPVSVGNNHGCSTCRRAFRPPSARTMCNRSSCWYRYFRFPQLIVVIVRYFFRSPGR